jgi:hypothetical protein
MIPDFYIEHNAIRVFVKIPDGATSRDIALAKAEVQAKADEFELALSRSYDEIFKYTTGVYSGPPTFKQIPYEMSPEEDRMKRGYGYVGILLTPRGNASWMKSVISQAIKNRSIRASKESNKMDRNYIASELLTAAKEITAAPSLRKLEREEWKDSVYHVLYALNLKSTDVLEVREGSKKGTYLINTRSVDTVVDTNDLRSAIGNGMVTMMCNVESIMVE